MSSAQAGAKRYLLNPCRRETSACLSRLSAQQENAAAAICKTSYISSFYSTRAHVLPPQKQIRVIQFSAVRVFSSGRTIGRRPECRVVYRPGSL